MAKIHKHLEFLDWKSMDEDALAQELKEAVTLGYVEVIIESIINSDFLYDNRKDIFIYSDRDPISNKLKVTVEIDTEKFAQHIIDYFKEVNNG